MGGKGRPSMPQVTIEVGSIAHILLLERIGNQANVLSMALGGDILYFVASFNVINDIFAPEFTFIVTNGHLDFTVTSLLLK